MLNKKPVIGITMDISGTPDGQYLRLKKYYAEAIMRAGAIPFLLPPGEDILSEVIDLIDGLLISGGGDIPPEYYGERPEAENLRPVDKRRIEFEFRILKEFIESKKPVLGICYGMQLINVFCRGSLYQDIKGHRKGFHEVKIRENRLIPSGNHTVNSSHHQAIKEKGKDIIEIGISKKDGIVEAITHKEYPNLFGIQWHPERMEDALSKSIFENFVSLSSSRGAQKILIFWEGGLHEDK